MGSKTVPLIVPAHAGLQARASSARSFLGQEQRTDEGCEEKSGAEESRNEEARYRESAGPRPCAEAEMFAGAHKQFAGIDLIVRLNYPMIYLLRDLSTYR